jgi:hypothetical protein
MEIRAGSIQAACEQAPNCEMVDGHPTFKEGMGPGSAYANNTNTLDARGLPSKYEIVVEISKHVIEFGTQNPHDAFWYLWDVCNAVSCDSHVHNIQARTPGCDNDGGCKTDIKISADGFFNNYEVRDALVKAILEQSTKEVGPHNREWPVGRVENRHSAYMNSYQHSRHIAALVRAKDGSWDMKGNMKLTIDSGSSKDGGCSRVKAIFQAMAGFILPQIAGIGGAIIEGACTGA